MSGPADPIRLRDVAFRYDPRGPDVLRGLSLDIPGGRVTALLGPNGSGKTTLLRLLVGALRPTAGRMELADRRMDARTARQRSRLVGLVPQEERVTFALRVDEFVLLGRAPHLRILERPGDADRSAAWAALRQAGIEGLAHREVTALSGGERQLVSVARVLAQQPRVVLMDEPTSHLDLGNTRRVLDLVRGLRRDGRTVVMTTHDPNAAVAVADHVVLLYDGRVRARGTPAEVIRAAHLRAAYGVDVDIVEAGGRPLVVVR